MGDRTYFKGKPKQGEALNEHIMRSRSPIGFPESAVRPTYQKDLLNLHSSPTFIPLADAEINLPKS